MTTEKKPEPVLARIKAGGLALKGRLDGLIGGAIPGAWLPVAFAGACSVALVLALALAFHGAPEPDEVINAHEARIAELQKSVQEAVAELGGEKTRASAADKELGRMTSQIASIETAKKKAEEQAKTLVQQIDTLRNERQEIDKKLALATREKREAERARDTAKAAQEADARKTEQLQARFDALTAQHNQLKTAQDAAAKVNEAAKTAFDEIIAFVQAVEVPERRIEALEGHRRARRVELDGTVYMTRLDEAIARETRVIEDARRKEAVVAKREAKDAYADYIRKLKMTPDLADTVALLETAREELKGTDYEVSVYRLLESNRTRLQQDRAKAAYVEATSRIAAQPREFEANLAILKEALDPAKGTRWGSAMEKEIAARTRSLADDIGRMAHDDFVAAQRAKPKAYDELIALGEELAPKAADSRYEAALAKRLEAVKTARREAIGAEAYAEARQLVTANAGDYEANIEALTGLKEVAAGSGYERSIESLLARERKLLAKRR